MNQAAVAVEHGQSLLDALDPDTLDNRLRLAGLPGAAEMRAFFSPAHPSPALQAASAAYVALHTAEMQEIASTCIGLA